MKSFLMSNNSVISFTFRDGVTIFFILFCALFRSKKQVRVHLASKQANYSCYFIAKFLVTNCLKKQKFACDKKQKIKQSKQQRRSKQNESVTSPKTIFDSKKFITIFLSRFCFWLQVLTEISFEGIQRLIPHQQKLFGGPQNFCKSKILDTSEI